MFEKLDATVEKYDRLEYELANNTALITDATAYAKAIKEYRSLTAVVEKYREYKRTEQDIEDALQIIDEADDEDMKAMAQDELKDAKSRLETLSQELTVLLIPRDPNDEKNVIVEIRAGAGGEEAALFAAVLYRMYSMYAATVGFKVSVANANETELGGYKEISFSVEGDGAYSRFKFESGVHRVQRVPETESQGRIQTSTATVAVLPEVEDVEIEIKDSDLIFESCKSSGAGGQHINKTESAVRLTHKPTGIVIECQEERSQFKNKDKALKMLRAKLYDIKQREQSEKVASDRKSQVGTGDRSEKIRTYNYPQNRVTDHRIGVTLYSLEDFLNGNIGGMIDSLIATDTAEKLKAENNN
ncbi:MAG: peptide chain release factor 1 [Ruminococcaceae bacterium]|nr:peptide chain release factor 1 [Oscillospiraceae bacterium]